MADYLPINPAEFDQLFEMLSQSPQFSGPDDDSVLSLYQLRRECAIVQAMHPEECEDPGLVLGNERLSRIANDAGVTKTEVAYLVHRQRPGVVRQRMYDSLDGRWQVTSLCSSTHDEMITGRCPWCGRQLFGSQPRW